MPADNTLWIPPLSPKAQKKANRRLKYQRLVKRTGFSGKTLWDWLNLIGILLVPLMIGAFTLSTTIQQSQIAQDQQQETALQAYLDHMSDLLLNSKLRESQPGDEVRNVARARTLTVLPQLNGTRKGEVIQFLQEAGLISQKNTIVDLTSANLTSVDLSHANLNSAALWGTNLHNADLSSAWIDNANLSGADLSGADLTNAIFDSAYITGANLSNANLSYTALAGADLSGADLTNADLSGADLGKADLSLASLSLANLDGTYLRDANVTKEQLKQAKSLKSAIMPDGSTHS